MSISSFIEHHYRHFNAATVRDAARSYVLHMQKGGKMMITLAGAMSTAELGLSLAEMIRAGHVHAITCTGANLEEDIFNLVAHDHYERIPNYRELTPQEETSLRQRGLNRVTDTCIPEDKAIRKIEHHILREWQQADQAKERLLPHQFMYRLLRSEVLLPEYQIDPKDSWLLAACQRDLPIFVPGWEDSTLGNIFAAHVIAGDISTSQVIRSGIDYMISLVEWYKASCNAPIGFFQIGGGIAGDFPICVVPLIHQDLQEECPYWSYFCQISDSTTSYGSYSGAVPNEKITWGKLEEHTPRFVIESDATIVAPMLFAYVVEKLPAANSQRPQESLV
jgi:deoxyhypusine synthase